MIHDFAVISLSDLLTPMEVIEKRVKAAAEADFAICIYNPSSKKRGDYLKKACEILLESRSPETVCGIVKSIGRQGEEIPRRICLLPYLSATLLLEKLEIIW